jgi:hypothetical protein
MVQAVQSHKNILGSRPDLAPGTALCSQAVYGLKPRHSMTRTKKTNFRRAMLVPTGRGTAEIGGFSHFLSPRPYSERRRWGEAREFNHDVDAPVCLARGWRSTPGRTAVRPYAYNLPALFHRAFPLISPTVYRRDHQGEAHQGSEDLHTSSRLESTRSLIPGAKPCAPTPSTS